MCEKKLHLPGEIFVKYQLEGKSGLWRQRQSNVTTADQRLLLMLKLSQLWLNFEGLQETEATHVETILGRNVEESHFINWVQWIIPMTNTALSNWDTHKHIKHIQLLRALEKYDNKYYT